MVDEIDGQGRRIERLSPHLSDMIGYLIRIEDPTFRMVKVPSYLGGPEEREQMTCRLTVLDPPTFGDRHMAVPFRRFRQPDAPGEVVIPYEFPDSIIGAWGLIAWVKRMLPHATSGRLTRFEAARRPGDRHSSRSYSMRPPTDADLAIIERYLAERDV